MLIPVEADVEREVTLLLVVDSPVETEATPLCAVLIPVEVEVERVVKLLLVVDRPVDRDVSRL